MNVTFLAVAFLISSAGGANLASARSKPRTIRAVHVGNPISVLDNQGDTWVCAWADDGELYSPSDDTFGFGRACDGNIAFNRIVGDDVLRLTGVTTSAMADYGASATLGPDGCSWKSSGCVAIDGVLYWVVARHSYGDANGDPFKRQIASNASVVKSVDGGKTWSRSARDNYDRPMFPGSRFATPYFIDYGKGAHGTVDRADRYVYAISNDGFWDNGDDMILGRVPRAKIGDLNGCDWEYYAGGDGLRATNWNHDVKRAAVILKQPNHLGMTGAAYVPAFRSYFMIGWYYPDSHCVI